MPCLFTTAVWLGIIASASASASASAGTVSIDFHSRDAFHEHFKAVARGLFQGHLSKRAPIQLLAANNISGGGYYADLEIGTPGQKLTFQLDTGSSDTWMNSVETAYCSSTQQSETGYCTAKFDPEKSSTFQVVSKGGFDIRYLDQREIKGDYFNDSVTINGKTITNQQLGLAISSVRPTGIMGLGFSANVASRTKYPTIIDNMVSQGVIEHPIFSLYLNDLDAKNGTILFGGIDTAKFTGELKTLSLQSMGTTSQTASGITSYAVSIKSVTVSSGASLPSTASNSIAILDSGSTITLVPDSIAADIHKRFGVVTIADGDLSTPPLVDCAVRGGKEKDTTFDFAFDGVTIKIPAREMAIDALPSELQQLVRSGNADVPAAMRNWQGACLFGIASAKLFGVKSDQFFLLGDTFLRSAYVAYDMQNKQLGLAQALLNATGSQVIAIAKDAKDFGSAKGSGAGNGAGNGAGSDAGRAAPSRVAKAVVLGLALVFATL